MERSEELHWKVQACYIFYTPAIRGPVDHISLSILQTMAFGIMVCGILMVIWSSGPLKPWVPDFSPGKHLRGSPEEKIIGHIRDPCSYTH